MHLSRPRSAAGFTLIFAGRLVKVQVRLDTGSHGADDSIYTYKFVPTKIWRGTKADTITLQSGHSNCSVMLPRRVANYVIFTDEAHKHDLGSCDRIMGNTDGRESQELDKLFLKPRFRKLLASN